eukprot:CAMPEP_0177779156 /NCGR_PEP_ID=MMETSP0491_2-20121128/16405_1 /TAXON_ID=63592 /ORGANISM="Tetraselmis chuii, Strain PLY429" /LENGTH=78 /DNA_ID=CAMNT_0019298613 /DNA_START=602 /DNA_END=838 /DNA_ORIENTATION=+
MERLRTANGIDFALFRCYPSPWRLYISEGGEKDDSLFGMWAGRRGSEAPQGELRLISESKERPSRKEIAAELSREQTQ